MGLRVCVSEKHSREANGAGPWSGEGLTRGKYRTVGYTGLGLGLGHGTGVWHF